MNGITSFQSFNDRDPTEKHTSFLIVGSIGNDGKRPLFPYLYSCKMINKDDNSTYELHQTMSDSTMMKLQTKYNFYIYDSAVTQSLSVVKKISATDVVYGNMLFVLDSLIDTRSKELYFEITCTDVYGDKYRSGFEGVLETDKKGRSVVMPYNGVKIIPK